MPELVAAQPTDVVQRVLDVDARVQRALAHRHDAGLHVVRVLQQVAGRGAPHATHLGVLLGAQQALLHRDGRPNTPPLLRCGSGSVTSPLLSHLTAFSPFATK